MLGKVVSSLGYLGVAGLLAALFYYSVYRQWDWKTQVALYGGAGLILVFLALNLSNIRAGLKTRTARYGSAAGATALLVLGILILANFLNFRHHRRLDLTENQLYSLSDQSRKVVEGLEAQVEVIGFFRSEAGRLPFEDLIQEYHYYSPRLTYELVDPEEDPGTANQYEIRRNGQVVVMSDTRQELVDDYSEEKITNAIIKVTRKEEKIVYFLQGHGERDVQDTEAQGFSAARGAVEKQNYQVKTYNLGQENRLPEDATVVVSAGPKVRFFPHEENLIREFLAAGGKFLLLADPDTDFEMEEFLSEYGLGLDKRVVIDASGLGQIFGLGAAAPLVAEYTDHPITEDLDGVMTFFPFAQTVTMSESSLDYETAGLVKSSANSWAESSLKEGRASYDEAQDRLGPLELAAVATREISHQDDGATDADKEQGEEQLESQSENQEESAQNDQREARFVLYGDSDFASNAYFDGGANGDLFLMTISWLAEEADLLAVRPRSPENRRIELTFAQSRLIFWGTVVLLPLVTVILGLSVWHQRR
jgi:ABC-type uncharacterized transport system involved in gliding motility auxiliary subunit